MFVFLDDVRDCPPNFHWVKNYEECVDILQNCNIDIISLDHDLGEEKTGYDVVKFMVQEGIFPKEIYIHSANPVGAQNMKDLLERYAPDNVIIRFARYTSKGLLI